MDLVPSLVLSLTGILASAYFGYLFGRRREVRRKEHDFKFARYKATIIYMISKLDPQKSLEHLSDHRPDIKSMDDVDDELRVEYLNFVLFASDSVVRSFGRFIKTPTHKTFVEAVSAMRRDLWGRKSSTSSEEIDEVLKSAQTDQVD